MVEGPLRPTVPREDVEVAEEGLDILVVGGLVPLLNPCARVLGVEVDHLLLTRRFLQQLGL